MQKMHFRHFVEIIMGMKAVFYIISKVAKKYVYDDIYRPFSLEGEVCTFTEPNLRHSARELLSSQKSERILLREVVSPVYFMCRQ